MTKRKGLAAKSREVLKRVWTQTAGFEKRTNRSGEREKRQKPGMGQTFFTERQRGAAENTGKTRAAAFFKKRASRGEKSGRWLAACGAVRRRNMA